MAELNVGLMPKGICEKWKKEKKNNAKPQKAEWPQRTFAVISILHIFRSMIGKNDFQKFEVRWKCKLHTLPGIIFAQVNKFLEIRVPGDVGGSKQAATFSSAGYCWENLSVCDNKGIFSPHLHKPPQANFKYLEMAAFFRDLFLICSSLNLCEQLTGEDFMMKESLRAASCADLCCAEVIKCQHFYAFNQSSGPLSP